MAIAWQGVASEPREQLQLETSTLIYEAEETGDGEWFDCADTISMHFDIEGITTGGVSIYGSNDLTVPANDADGTLLNAEITANAFFDLDRHQIPRWVKAKVSSWTEGKFIVYCRRYRQSYS